MVLERAFMFPSYANLLSSKPKVQNFRYETELLNLIRASSSSVKRISWLMHITLTNINQPEPMNGMFWDHPSIAASSPDTAKASTTI